MTPDSLRAIVGHSAISPSGVVAAMQPLAPLTAHDRRRRRTTDFQCVAVVLPSQSLLALIVVYVPVTRRRVLFRRRSALAFRPSQSLAYRLFDRWQLLCALIILDHGTLTSGTRPDGQGWPPAPILRLREGEFHSERDVAGTELDVDGTGQLLDIALCLGGGDRAASGAAPSRLPTWLKPSAAEVAQ
jgi:hypothetical protein